MKKIKWQILIKAGTVFFAGFMLFFATNIQAQPVDGGITISGKCGSAKDQKFSSAPTANLCDQTWMTASAVAFDASTLKWKWTCTGSPEATVSCTALAAPACGSSNNQSFASIPASNLCSIGTASGVSGSGPWSWTCSANSSSVSCSAAKINSCGTAKGKDIPGDAKFSGNYVYDKDGNYWASSSDKYTLCSDTSSSPAVTKGTSTYSWACSGTNCTANVYTIDGKCASPPNGATYSSFPSPTPKLCSVGWCPSGTTVFGTGPWTWTCCGYYGGKADSCQANYACLSTNWTPDPSTVCSGTQFWQKDNCGNSKLAWGTNNPEIWTPDPSTVCSGLSFVQTNGCTNKDATGIKDCSTLAPTLTFSASPNPVDYNTSTILTWKTTNATSCSASGDWSGTKEINGSETSLKLTVKQTFTLECWNSANVSSGPQSVTVDVNSCVSDDYQCNKIDPVCPSTTGIAFCANTCGETNPSKCSDCAPKTITCEKTDSGIWTEVKP